MSASTSSGPGPNCEVDVMGQNPTNASQQAAPLFDLRTGDVARSHTSSAGIGSPDQAQEVTDAAAGVHRGARERGGMADGGTGTAAGGAGDRFPQHPVADEYGKVALL